MKRYLIAFCIGFITNIGLINGQSIVKDLVTTIRAIESGEEAALNRYFSNPKELFHCLEDPDSSSHENCAKTAFIHDYFQLSYFPMFSDKVKFPLSDYYREFLKSFPVKDRQLKVETLGPAVTYLSVFEDYILRGRPFKRNCEKCTQTSRLLLNPDFWEANPVYDDFYLLNIPRSKDLPELYFPDLLSNHYLRRLFPSNPLLTDHLDFFRSSCLDLPCLVESESRPLLFQCPLNSHAVVWSPEGVSPESPLIVQLVDLLQIAQKLATTATTQDPTLSPFFHIHSNLTDSLYHFLSYSMNDNPEVSKEETDKRFLASFSLTASQEVAFIPRQYLVHIPASATKKRFLMQCLVDASNLQLFIQSLDSFSSLSLFHNQLRKEIQAFLANDLLTSFHHKQSQQFTVFEKKPAELSFESYFQPEIISSTTSSTEGEPEVVISKNNRKNRKKDFQSWQGGIQWKQLMYSLLLPQPWTSSGSPSTSLSIGEIGRRSLSLQWTESTFIPSEQDQSKFGFKVWICNLTSPDLLLVDNTSYLSRSVNHEGDKKDNYRYEVHYYSTAMREEITKGCEERVYLVGDPHLSSQTIIMTTPPPPPLVESSEESTPHKEESTPHTEEPVAAFLPEKEILQFTLTIDHLHPSTYYQIRLAMVYGASEGPASRYSTRLRTRPLLPPSPPSAPLPNTTLRSDWTQYGFDQYLIESTRPILATNSRRVTISETNKEEVQAVDLYFQPPRDDGGKPILGYVVYNRVMEGDFPSQWTYKGVYSASDAQVRDDYSFDHMIYYYYDDGIKHGNGNLKITIYNLMDAWHYEFKVVAFNEIGDSEYSSKSNPILIIPPADSDYSPYHYFSFAHQLAATLSTSSHLQWRLTPTVEALTSLSHRRELDPDLHRFESSPESLSVIRDHRDFDVDFSANLFLQLDISRETLRLPRPDLPPMKQTTHEVWRSHWSNYRAVLHAKPFYFNYTLSPLASGDFHPQALLEQVPPQVQTNFSQRIVLPASHATSSHESSRSALSKSRSRCSRYSRY